LDLASIRLKRVSEVYVLYFTLLISFALFLKENCFMFVDNLKVNYFSLHFTI